MTKEEQELLEEGRAELEASKERLRATQIASVVTHVELLCLVVQHTEKRIARLLSAIEATNAFSAGLELTAGQDAEMAEAVAALERAVAETAQLPQIAWAKGAGSRVVMADLGIAFDAEAVFEVVVGAIGDMEAAMPPVISLLTLTVPLTGFVPEAAHTQR